MKENCYEFFYVNETYANFPYLADAMLRAMADAQDKGSAKVYGVTPDGKGECLYTLYKGQH